TIVPVAGTYAFVFNAQTSDNEASVSFSPARATVGTSVLISVTIAQGFQRGDNFAVIFGGESVDEITWNGNVGTFTRPMNQGGGVQVVVIGIIPSTYSFTFNADDSDARVSATFSQNLAEVGQNTQIVLTILPAYQRATNFLVMLGDRDITGYAWSWNANGSVGTLSVPMIEGGAVLTVVGIVARPTFNFTFNADGSHHSVSVAFGTASTFVGGNVQITITITPNYRRASDFRVMLGNVNITPFISWSGNVGTVTRAMVQGGADVTVTGVEIRTYSFMFNEEDFNHRNVSVIFPDEPVQIDQPMTFEIIINETHVKGDDFLVMVGNTTITDDILWDGRVGVVTAQVPAGGAFVSISGLEWREYTFTFDATLGNHQNINVMFSPATTRLGGNVEITFTIEPMFRRSLSDFIVEIGSSADGFNDLTNNIRWTGNTGVIIVEMIENGAEVLVGGVEINDQTYVERGETLLAEIRGMGFNNINNPETSAGVFRITAGNQSFWNTTTGTNLVIDIFSQLADAELAAQNANTIRYGNIVVSGGNEFGRWLFATIARLGAPRSMFEDGSTEIAEEFANQRDLIVDELNRHLDRPGQWYNTMGPVAYTVGSSDTRIIISVHEY
ncbi:MAG: hypothetical protein FWC11_00750, partial [Firmicutes bacterium]|nr:hypothetical protein [Bacillota bacterium]